MAVHSFRTIQAPAEGLYKEKGSKFFAFAYPVSSEEEIRTRLDILKKEYFDARHHCFAYILGAEKNKFRAFDDGEPNHSAGDPILGQLRSKELTNVLVVVVRYFGGTKLGVGGLISAYKTAAEDALSKAAIVEKEISSPLTIRYNYISTAEVMRLVKEFDLEIHEQTFLDDCTLTVSYRIRDEEKLFERLQVLKATRQVVSFDRIHD